MKKYIIVVLLLLFVLSGCGHIGFHGESENWKGEYSAYIDGTSERGEYTFGFKNANTETSFENLKIEINDGESTYNSSLHKGATVKMSSACSGCAVTRESDTISVTITWDNENEETFYLE